MLAELRRGVFKRYAQALAKSEALDLAPDEALAHTVALIVEVLKDNLELERVFREAESAGDTQRAALQGRARLSEVAGRQIEAGVVSGAFSTQNPRLSARFIITLFDNILYESLVYGSPDKVGVVAASALRFVLLGLGVAPSRAEALASPLESLCP